MDMRNRLHMGAVMPRDGCWPRTMAHYVDNSIHSRPVIELGPGTGRFNSARDRARVDRGAWYWSEYNTGFGAWLRESLSHANVVQGDAYRLRRLALECIEHAGISCVSACR